MPQFPGSITDPQADAIIASLALWITDDACRYPGPGAGRSMIAAIVCDAVSADITLQPLHDAFGRKYLGRK